MSERPESYWSPLLLPLRPCDLGDLTPEQMMAAVSFAEGRLSVGAV